MKKTKKFSELMLELKKMSFMDLVNMSDDIPEDSDVEQGKDPVGRADKPQPQPKPVVVTDDEDDEDAPAVKSDVGELQTSKTVRELLGPKLFASYASLKKIKPDLDVREFIQGEIRDIEKALPRLKGADLSGAKTRLRLLGVKLDDAEMVIAELNEITMTEFMDALARAKVKAEDVVKDEDRISVKFQIGESDSTKLLNVIKGFGAKPGRYGYTPPYDPWFAEGCEWRVYPPANGSVRVHAVFPKL